jgi:hypothetical protein
MKGIIMKLKTATLIAMVCVTLHFILSFLLLYLRPEMPLSLSKVKLFGIINMILLNGGIVLFLWAFYHQQKQNIKEIIPSDIKTGSTQQGCTFIGKEYDNAENTAQKRTSQFAKASFVSSISAIPTVIICGVISRTVIYNPPLMKIAELLFYLSCGLIFISFLSGITGLIHIALKGKKFYGYRVALGGIGLSIILIITLLYNLLVAMGEHIW